MASGTSIFTSSAKCFYTSSGMIGSTIEIGYNIFYLAEMNQLPEAVSSEFPRVNFVVKR